MPNPSEGAKGQSPDPPESNQCLYCDRWLCTDEDRGERYCEKCGYAVKDSITTPEPNLGTDEEGKPLRHDETGVGTDVNKTANENLRRYTRGHVIRPPHNKKYKIYTASRLKYIIKTNTNLKNLKHGLEYAVHSRVDDFIVLKKDAKRGIEKIRHVRKVGDDTIVSIRYPELDNIIRQTVIDFCNDCPSCGIIINADALELHRHPIYTNNGVKSGTQRGNYKGRYPGLKEKKCTKHGKFEESSHNSHHKKVHLEQEKEKSMSFPTYLDTYVRGYKEWNDLKSSKPSDSASAKSKAPEPMRCKVCLGIVEKVKKVRKKTLKSGEVEYDERWQTYHVLNVGGRKVLTGSCSGRKKMPAVMVVNMDTLYMMAFLAYMSALVYLHMYMDPQTAWMFTMLGLTIVGGCGALWALGRLIQFVYNRSWTRKLSEKLYKTTRRFLKRFAGSRRLWAWLDRGSMAP